MTGFKRATKGSGKLRLALAGPAGSGKTFTALKVAAGLAAGRRVAVVDTEHGSASKYADLFDFDTLELDSFNPQQFIDAITEAEAADYAVIILDSLSHAWMGKDGTLDLVDKAAKRSQSGNSFTAWKDITPLQNALIDRILAANMHVIATLRVKTEYVIVENERGKKEPKKIGMQPIQRDQVEYEFDVYGDLDQDNTLIIGKTRCPALSGAVIRKPGQPLAQTLSEWLTGTPDMVQSADDRLWQRWLEILSEAQGLGVQVPQPGLPIARVELTKLGSETVARIKERRNSAEYGRTIGAADWGEGPSQRSTSPAAVVDEPEAEPSSGSVPMVTTKAHPLWRAWLEAERQARVAEVPHDFEVSLPLSEESLRVSTAALLEMVAEAREGVV